MYENKTAFRLEEYIGTGRRLHFIAVGGVHMSAIAELLHKRGCTVTGSDKTESDNTIMLRRLGIDIKIGHKAEYVHGADAIVRNAAIKDDFPDIMEAKHLGMRIFERPQVLGAIMSEYPIRICVSGTHGKTTTTSMCTMAAMAAGCDPTAFCGAAIPSVGHAYTFGHGDMFIAEACEYCDSFLHFSPTTAVILNVEEDHLDYFSGIEQIKRSFTHFASLTPPNGYVIVNGSDKNSIEAAERSGKKYVTFGIGDSYDYSAVNVASEAGYPAFTVKENGTELVRLTLSIPGKHNIMNALAAFAASHLNGIDTQTIKRAIESFTGAARRFQRVGSLNGAAIVDDFAHHPTELSATLNAARSMGYNRVICVFQPHTYTRLLALADDFRNALKLADEVILAPIYAAREVNTTGVTSKLLMNGLDNAEYIESFDAIAEKLRADAKQGDIVLTVGAGDIFKLAKQLI